MLRLLKTLITLCCLFLYGNAFAAECSAEPITGTTDCYRVPDSYTITMYQMGLCNGVDTTVATVPDIATSCQVTFNNTSGSSIAVQNNISSALSGGTSTKPTNGTYDYGFIKVDARIFLQTSHTFAATRAGSNSGSGTTCWTNGNAASTGTTTDCGTAAAANPQDMTVDVISLGGTVLPMNNFYNRYEGDAEGLDDTYAWLVDSDGNASTSINYSSSAGDVKYLIGVEKFTTSKTVSDSTSAMEAQFRVTRGLKIDFTSTTVNYNLQEFKVVTDVY